MKTPIEASDIRVGDTVERDHLGVTTKLTVHHIMEPPAQVGFYSIDLALIVHRPGARWFLLDRPTPPVELPSTPTLGWASWRKSPQIFLGRSGESELGMWKDISGTNEPLRFAFRPLRGAGLGVVYPERITAFTPATAVPTEALEAWQADACTGDCCATNAALLAAIDAAGSAE